MDRLIDSLVQRALTLIARSANALYFVPRIWQRRQGAVQAGRMESTGLQQTVSVTGGLWWYSEDDLPRPGTAIHTYFPSSTTISSLADSLVRSKGRDAVLSAVHFRVAILRTAWSGLQIASGHSEADREVSSGRASHPARLVRIRDACVALQRNDTNYGHFITEVLPSIVAWETSSLFPCRLVVAKSSFAVPLLRMMGFEGAIDQVHSPSLVLATNVTVLRLLPAGMYHPRLLREVARRAHVSTAGHATRACRVVFLTRTTSATRRLTNEADVVSAIQEVFPDVDVFYSGEATVVEQVARMANATVVISTFGAQAMNMVWATAMKHFVEITFYRQDKRCFAALAEALGAQPHVAPSRAKSPGDHYSDHECDLGSLRQILTGIQIQGDRIG